MGPKVVDLRYCGVVVGLITSHVCGSRLLVEVGRAMYRIT